METLNLKKLISSSENLTSEELLELFKNKFSKRLYRLSKDKLSVEQGVGKKQLQWYTVCYHGTRESRCKLCGGSEICLIHNVRKSRCKECKGVERCSHGTLRYGCRECKGKRFCEHGKKKYTCKECLGQGICTHNKIKTRCLECKDTKGSEICKHNKYYRTCVECGGSLTCFHEKQINSCIECSPNKCETCGKLLCRKSYLTHVRYHNNCGKCKLEGVSAIFNFKYCYQCGCDEIGRTPIQKRQDIVFKHLEKTFGDEIKIEFDKKINSINRRPDSAIITNFCKIFIEVDEKQHNKEDYRCLYADISKTIQNYDIDDNNDIDIDREKNMRKELKEDERMNEIANAVKFELPTIFIRFNPDCYRDETGKKQNINLDERLPILEKEIRGWLNKDLKIENHITVVHLYYNGKYRTVDFLPSDGAELEKYLQKFNNFM